MDMSSPFAPASSSPLHFDQTFLAQNFKPINDDFCKYLTNELKASTNVSDLYLQNVISNPQMLMIAKNTSGFAGLSLLKKQQTQKVFEEVDDKIDPKIYETAQKYIAAFFTQFVARLFESIKIDETFAEEIFYSMMADNVARQLVDSTMGDSLVSMISEKMHQINHKSTKSSTSKNSKYLSYNKDSLNSQYSTHMNMTALKAINLNAVA